MRISSFHFALFDCWVESAGGLGWGGYSGSTLARENNFEGWDYDHGATAVWLTHFDVRLAAIIGGELQVSQRIVLIRLVF